MELVSGHALPCHRRERDARNRALYEAAGRIDGLDGDVTGNDEYLAGSAFTKATDPSNGSVTVNSDGTYTYSPDADFTGADSFTYTVCLPAPNGSVCDTATVTLTGGTLSTAAMQTLVDAISYQNDSDNPNTANRVVTITDFRERLRQELSQIPDPPSGPELTAFAESLFRTIVDELVLLVLAGGPGATPTQRPEQEERFASLRCLVFGRRVKAAQNCQATCPGLHLQIVVCHFRAKGCR